MILIRLSTMNFIVCLLLLNFLQLSTSVEHQLLGENFFSDSKLQTYLQEKFTSLPTKYRQHIEKLFPKRTKVSSKAVSDCFDGKFKGTTIDLFGNGSSPLQIATKYYKMMNKYPQPKEMLGFMNSLEYIIQHVQNCDQHKKAFKLGFTDFSDQPFTESQLRPRNFSIESPLDWKKSLSDCNPPNNYRPLANVDWRRNGCVTSVKKQGSCGSCWAFAVTGTVESAYLKSGKTRDRNINLSEQQLVNFVRECHGCEGGNTLYTFNYIYNNGQTTEQQCPYLEYQNPFDVFDNYPKVAFIENFCVHSIYNNGQFSKPKPLSDNDIAKIVSHFGPVTALMYSSTRTFQNYKGGILDFSCPNNKIDHMVMIVGYDDDSWILKNSWGTEWGENGFFRLARRKNMCGIQNEIGYPIV